MIHFRIHATVLLAIAAGLQADFAIACRPKINHVSDYKQNKIHSQVIFLGIVVAVTERQYPDETVQDIEFRTTRWFGGTRQENVIVRGLITHRFLTDCHGVFDFSANVGEEWLIFGQLREGRIDPDKFLSQRVKNEVIPSSLLKQLE